jgi:hypothetical protein
MNNTPPTKIKTSKGLYFGVLVVVILILGCLSPVGWFAFQIHRDVKRSIVYADSGFRRATNTINPEELRAWALENVQKNSSPKELALLMPENIRSLYNEPPDAWLDGSCVCLFWGGGFFHWGLYVGNTNEIMAFISQNQEYPYNFEWKPGIYYTREAKWDLQ